MTCTCMHCEHIKPPNSSFIRRNMSLPKRPINKNLKNMFVDTLIQHQVFLKCLK